MIHCGQIDLLGNGKIQLLGKFKGFLTVCENQPGVFFGRKVVRAFVSKYKVDLWLSFPRTSRGLGCSFPRCPGCCFSFTAKNQLWPIPEGDNTKGSVQVKRRHRRFACGYCSLWLLSPWDLQCLARSLKSDHFSLALCLEENDNSCLPFCKNRNCLSNNKSICSYLINLASCEWVSEWM